MPRWRPRAILSPSDLPVPRAAVAPEVLDELDDPSTPAAPAPTAGQTNYFGRLVAYIPAEVIAVYQAVAGPVGDTKSVTTNALAATAPVKNESVTSGAATGLGNSLADGLPLAGAGVSSSFLLWFGLGLLALTPVWFYYSTKDKGEPPAKHQIINSTLAFLIWLLAVSNPIVELLPGWRAIYATAAMVLAAAIIFPLIEIKYRKK